MEHHIRRSFGEQIRKIEMTLQLKKHGTSYLQII